MPVALCYDFGVVGICRGDQRRKLRTQVSVEAVAVVMVVMVVMVVVVAAAAAAAAYMGN